MQMHWLGFHIYIYIFSFFPKTITSTSLNLKRISIPNPPIIHLLHIIHFHIAGESGLVMLAAELILNIHPMILAYDSNSLSLNLFLLFIFSISNYMQFSEYTVFSSLPSLHSLLHLRRTLLPLSQPGKPLFIFQDLDQASILCDDYSDDISEEAAALRFCAHIAWLLSIMAFIHFCQDSVVKYLLNAEFQR